MPKYGNYKLYMGMIFNFSMIALKTHKYKVNAENEAWNVENSLKMIKKSGF